ncbi:MAG TPA: dienelactone hydrolase family protein [Propionibacteriaceae bacterium]|nr:dienelactone hydrolase family protein [Propionibacteriaceae bacterium]
MSDLAALTSAEPLTGPVVALLLHGFGSSEADLAGLAPHVMPGLPWASLRAPIVLGRGSYAWFRIGTPGDPELAPVDAAVQTVWDWVDAHLDPETRVVGIGFSQGGVMASELLRTRPERVAATVVLGGFVQSAERPGDAHLAELRPPVFWGRGSEDRVIAPDAVARTEAWLPAHSTLTGRVYSGLAHGISAEEASDVAAFVASVVATPDRAVPIPDRAVATPDRAVQPDPLR